jgi:Gram-negative bacterial TonB protein C-terminal
MILNKLLLFFALSFSSMAYSQKVYTLVDVQPEYPNGMAALFKYLGQNVKYSQKCKENGIEGKLYICFIIETDGLGSYTPCEKGNHCADEESIKKMLQSMPKWKPGLIKGKPVRVSYKIPINIHLE